MVKLQKHSQSTLNKYRCSKCNKFKKRVDVIKNAKRTKVNGDIVIYWWCNSCNSERLRKYRKTEIGRLNTNKAVYKSVKKLYYKQKARLFLNLNVRMGRIKKPTKCQVCNKKSKVEGHHKDYKKPLDVIWLCRNCHKLEHR